MPLFALIYFGPIAFAVVCVQRLMTWRRTHSGRPVLASAHLVRLARVTLLAAGFGLILITVIAAALLANYRQEQRTNSGFTGLETIAIGGGVYLLVIPVVTWIGMRSLGVRPAGLAAFGAWVLLGTALLIIQKQIPGGAIQSAWFYGLVAPVPYALAAAAVACVPARDDDHSPSNPGAPTTRRP